MTVEQFRSIVHRHVTSRPVVLIGADLERLGQDVHGLRAMGAERVMVVAGGAGSGSVPNLDGYEYVEVDVPERGEVAITEPAWASIFASPPPHLAAALERFDPHREAAVIPWRFRRSRALGDRPVFGPRMPEAIALEDKTRIGPLLTELEIPQPPGAITVGVDSTALGEATRRVDRGAGAVWSGDAKTATNSGTKFVRRVRDGLDMYEAHAFFAEHCNEVRVAPFLEGVACGMHAFVTPQGTAVFRPVELLIYRPGHGTGFVDAGFSTTFDPEPTDTAEYRGLTRRIGDELYRRHGYQGAISVDAILTEDGWAVHDINPRQGGGLVYVQHTLPDMPIHLLHHVAAEAARRGVPLELDFRALEDAVVSAANARRMVVSAFTAPEGPRRRRTIRTRGARGERVDLRYRPLRGGGGGRIDVAAAGRAGEQIAPKVASALRHADAVLGLGLALEAPRDVRTEALRIREAETFGAERSTPPSGRESGPSEGVTPSL